jgi:uncharacterized protein (DUF736 family)
VSDKYDNSGVLFKNDKGDNPKRPDYRGSISVVGVDYNISGWIRESKKSGDKFLSLKVEAKDAYKPRGDAPKKAEPKVAQKGMTEDNWSDLDEPF